MNISLSLSTIRASCSTHRFLLDLTSLMLPDQQLLILPLPPPPWPLPILEHPHHLIWLSVCNVGHTVTLFHEWPSSWHWNSHPLFSSRFVLCPGLRQLFCCYKRVSPSSLASSLLSPITRPGLCFVHMRCVNHTMNNSCGRCNRHLVNCVKQTVSVSSCVFGKIIYFIFWFSQLLGRRNPTKYNSTQIFVYC